MKSILTSSSVVAFRYSNGIILSSDTSLNYGSLKMNRGISKHFFLSDKALMMAKGEYSDFQELIKICEEEKEYDDTMGIKEWIRFIQRTLYCERSRLEPLNVNVIIAGYDEKYAGTDVKINSIEQFGSEFVLGSVDNIGNFYTDDIISSGIGSFLSLPYLRDGDVLAMNRDKSIHLMKEVMQTLYYRDCMADNHINILGIEKEGIWQHGEVVLDSNWDEGRYIK